MDNASWVQAWAAILAVGLGSFYLVVLVVIPLGARDIFRLFARLDRKEDTDEERR